MLTPSPFLNQANNAPFSNNNNQDQDFSSLSTVTTATQNMPTPGLMFIGSKITDPNVSDADYNKFYNEEHLPGVLAFFKKHGIDNAFALRYRNVTNSHAYMPYLALYPVPDAQWILSPDQKRLTEDTKKSKILGVDNIWEHMDFHLRPYEKIQNYEGFEDGPKTGKDRGRTLVYVGMEPGPSEEQEKDFEDWYRKQHLDQMAMIPEYKRTVRYKRMDGEKPRYLAFHEYAGRPEDMPTAMIGRTRETEWSKKILAECQIFDRDVFELIEEQGAIEQKL